MNRQIRKSGFAAIAAALALLAACPITALAQAPPQPQFTPQQLEFFEHEVAPILKANCIACHGAEKKVHSGLYLTSREGLLKGGENGPVVSLAKPDESSLLEAINYRTYEMPPKGKLAQAHIDVLTRWVKMGLPWPADEKGQSDSSRAPRRR